MSSIKYRRIEKKDYSVVSSLISNSFGLSGYVKHDAVLKAFQKQYLFSCLAEATYTCVAEKDGQVIGIIMGNAKQDYKILSHLSYMIAMICYGILMSVRSVRHQEKLEGYKNLHRIYVDFFKVRKNEFDVVLTLFAVTEDCRGLGVGKNLLSNLMEYLKKNDVKNIYLFTDTTCNCFYDSQGFKQLDEKELTVTCNQEPIKMDVYLYGYKIK